MLLMVFLMVGVICMMYFSKINKIVMIASKTFHYRHYFNDFSVMSNNIKVHERPGWGIRSMMDHCWGNCRYTAYAAVEANVSLDQSQFLNARRSTTFPPNVTIFPFIKYFHLD